MVKKIAAIIISIGISQWIFSQDSFKQIISDFEIYSDKTIHEKVFIHSDRSFYITGEYIWFKLYITDASTNSPIDLSKVAYIELIAENNVPVIQSKIKIKDGFGSGSAFIPASIKSGNYKLRAYTRWMRNFDPAFYFNKVITVINPFESLPSQINENKEEYDIQFFPEGGNLISGIMGRMAFRVVNKNGKGFSFKGIILNENHDTIASFSPYKFGIGSFSLKPQADVKYTAIFLDSLDQPFAVKTLPLVHEKGFSMHLEDNPEYLLVNVFSKPAINGNIFALVHTGNEIVFSTAQLILNGNAQFIIKKNDLKEGISHIIIFDPNNNPVCERLYFTPPKPGLTLTAKSEKREYGNREKVHLTINQRELEENSDLSVSIYRKDMLSGTEEMDITSYILLTSDLKGNIECPSYYLGNSDSVKHATDNLMLTHGWSRFKWDEILNKNYEYKYIPEHTSQIVYGGITDIRTGKPAPAIITYLSVPGKLFHLNCAISNSNGEVYFEIPDHLSSDKMLIQTDYTKDSVYRVNIASPFSDVYDSLILPPLVLSEKYKNPLENRSINMQLRNIYNNDKTNISVSDSVLIYGKPDETYYLDDFTRFTVLEEVLREYVTSVYVRKKGKDFYFIVSNNLARIMTEGNPLVLLDGMPIFDVNEMMKYDPLKIQRLDVLKEEYYLKILKFQGIVSFITYNGDMPDLNLNSHVQSFDITGLQDNKEFFSPKYETSEQVESHLPDFRDLLYWNPSIKPDRNGNFNTDFYTSDQKGKYVIITQGLSENGKSGFTSSEFEVK